MTGTKITIEEFRDALYYQQPIPISWAVGRFGELLKQRDYLQQQVDTLQHQLEIQTKAAEIGAKNLIVAEQQVNKLTKALVWIKKESAPYSYMFAARIYDRAEKTLQSIKESPREEQTK